MPQRNTFRSRNMRSCSVCAGQIERKCKLAQSTVSDHLRTLQRTGLITCQKLGPIHFFKRHEDTIEMLVETLKVML